MKTLNLLGYEYARCPVCNAATELDAKTVCYGGDYCAGTFDEAGNSIRQLEGPDQHPDQLDLLAGAS